MKYSFAILHCKRFGLIEQTVNKATEICPVLPSIVSKVRLTFRFGKADGFNDGIWKAVGAEYALNPCIALNLRLLSTKVYDTSEVSGILWHELGHTISYFICLQENHFYVSKTGMIMYQPASDKFSAPISIRNKLLNEFWEAERMKYGHTRMDNIERILQHTLITVNSSELLAECFKYAYAGEGIPQNNYICKEDFQLIKSVLHDFITQHVTPNAQVVMRNN